MKFKNAFFCFVALFLGIADLAYAAEAMTVRIKGGRIQEYVNGSLKRN
jgi:hypothetical protein